MTEDRGQMTEDRGLRTEVRGQRTDDGGQRTEDRGRRSEDRRLKTDGRFQVSARPSAKKTAGLIEKETLEKRISNKEMILQQLKLSPEKIPKRTFRGST